MVLWKRAICIGFSVLGAAVIITPSAEAQQPEDEQRIQRIEQRIGALEAEKEGNPHEPPEYGNPHEPPRYEERHAWISPLRWETDDERYSLGIRGRIQPRYSYERRDAGDRSSFTLRRIRLDVRGHAFHEALTYRIMPEMTGGYSLRDGWINYRVAHGHGLRAGQYNIPAFLERSIGTNRHAFTERSTANDVFQWPTGRDMGVMSHGRLDRLRYGIGFFGGGGRNDEGKSTSGHLYSVRSSYTILGSYPGGLNLVEPVEGVNLAVGGGGYYANKSNPRGDDWRGLTGVNELADVASFAGDITFQHRFMTASLQGFYRELDPRDGAGTAYGTGYTAEAGALIIPETLFVGYRHSWADPNHSAREFRQRGNTLGVQWYQHGDGAKVSFEYGLIDGRDGGRWNRNRIFRVQYQLLF